MRRKQTLTQPLAGGADWKPCRSGTTSRTDLTSSIDALSGEKERLSQMNHGQRDREGTPNTSLPLRRRSWMRSSEAEEREGAFATAVLDEEQSSGGEEEQQRSAAVRSS